MTRNLPVTLAEPHCDPDFKPRATCSSMNGKHKNISIDRSDQDPFVVLNGIRQV